MTAMPVPAPNGRGEVCFAVVPDHPDAHHAAALLAGPAARVLRHASGRPWLIGRWPDEQAVVGQSGNTRVAVLGHSIATRADLNRVAEKLHKLSDVDRLARALPGSYHLLVSHVDGTRVQGSASGLRLVFHARLGNCVIAADRADLLARATGSGVDEREIAVRLLWPVPHPLPERSMWHGINAVSPGHALVIRPDGRDFRVTPWWEPPQATSPLAASIDRVRDTLSQAVRARTKSHDVVSCDFSGGFDSTSLCFLAARTPAQVIANTWPGRDPGDNDLWWAEHAASYLPGVEHLVWPAEQSPLVYTGLLDIDDPMDEPSIGVLDRARVVKHLPGLLSRGSRLHLTGIGGDHVSWCSEAYYHRLLRRRPLLAASRLRGFRALWQWPLSATVLALLDGRSYPRWLHGCARRLREPADHAVTTALGWGMAPRMFDWMTSDAVAVASDALRDAARSAEPLATDRGMHADLEQIRGCTRIVRQWDGIAARAGLPMASPFLDDRVIEAFLSVHPRDRVTPWRYKPVLAEAMRGVVPDSCLRRTTKAQAVLDASTGLREHRGDLLRLWEESHLAELGLVDAGKLRDLAHRPDTPALRDAILYSTIAVEVWLRTLTRQPAPEGVSR